MFVYLTIAIDKNNDYQNAMHLKQFSSNIVKVDVFTSKNNSKLPDAVTS